MHVSLLSSLPRGLTFRWVADGLRSSGHDVDPVERRDLAPDDAPSLGYRLADSWTSPPDVVLALDWVSGLAALVAARERPVPVAVRLPRPGRSADPAAVRVERAVARSRSLVLAAGLSDAETLVTLGAPRSAVRVLTDAVPVTGGDGDTAPHTTRAGDVVVAVDDTEDAVDEVLRGMAAGRPAVVAEVGVLPDLVADGVSGIVVPAAEVADAARSLQSDSMAREAMGLAAADRAAACFDVAVVTPRLVRVLDEARHRALAAA